MLESREAESFAVKLEKMGFRAACVCSTCGALACALLLVQYASAQSAAPTFDSRAVESATAISGGVCSNPAIGISYQLPEGMKPEDAAMMHQLAVVGSSSRGIGPEARYFLYGYEEAKTAVMICGASSGDGQTGLMAMPVSALPSQGPRVLDQIVQSMVQEFHRQPSSPYRKAVGRLEFDCADAQAEMRAPVRGMIEIWGSFCAAQVNSYVVMLSLMGYSKDEWEHLITGMDSVKVFEPRPIAVLSPPSPCAPNPGANQIAPDFQARIDGFLKAWLTDRDRAKTLKFFDRAAYGAPPLIGAYCSGWYRRGAPPEAAEQFIAQNLMGVPTDFPKDTPPAAIFKAWNRLPQQWVSNSANNVDTDHFLVARLDTDSLSRIFSGVFAGSDYHKFLESEIRRSGSAYWAVFPELMPDGDIFVIFTLWQKSKGNWKGTDIDVVCQ